MLQATRLALIAIILLIIAAIDVARHSNQTPLPYGKHPLRRAVEPIIIVAGHLLCDPKRQPFRNISASVPRERDEYAQGGPRLSLLCRFSVLPISGRQGSNT